MPTQFIEPTPPQVGYDYKKTLLAAGKVGLMAAAGVVLADQSGLTTFVVSHLPAQYAPLGALLLTAALAALKNFLTNRNKPA